MTQQERYQIPLSGGQKLQSPAETAKPQSISPVPNPGQYYFGPEGHLRPEIAEKIQQLREGKY